MTRSRYHSVILHQRFPDMQPLQSPDRNLTMELASVGCFAAQEGDKLFLIIGYRPKSGIAERFDEATNRVRPFPEAFRVVPSLPAERFSPLNRFLKRVSRAAGAGLCSFPQRGRDTCHMDFRVPCYNSGERGRLTRYLRFRISGGETPRTGQGKPQ